MKGILAALFLLSNMIGLHLYQEKPLAQSIEDGAIIYEDFCLQCHGSQGNGVPGTFPPLAQSDYLKKNLNESIQGIKFGMNGPITVNGTPYNGVMVNQGLDDEEIADVMNYILSNWGNELNQQITPQQVEAIQKTK